MPVDPLARLIAIEDIRNLKARYFRAVDTKDRDAFEATFTPDAVIDFRETTTDSADKTVAFETLDNGELFTKGAAAWADVIQKASIGVVSMHHGHMPEIEITSADTAKGIWHMEDIVVWDKPTDVKRMHGWGYYYEDYVRVNGKWLISKLRLARVRVEVETV